MVTPVMTISGSVISTPGANQGFSKEGTGTLTIDSNLGFGGAYRGPSNIVGILLIVLLVVLLLRAAP